MAALLRLPARQRQVVALRLFLDLDTAGTAQVLHRGHIGTEFFPDKAAMAQAKTVLGDRRRR